jgi:hypothetical protein
MDLGLVIEPKKLGASFGSFVLTHRVSGSIGLDQPPSDAPSRGFLAVKAADLRG